MLVKLLHFYTTSTSVELSCPTRKAILLRTIRRERFGREELSCFELLSNPIAGTGCSSSAIEKRGGNKIQSRFRLSADLNISPFKCFRLASSALSFSPLSASKQEINRTQLPEGAATIPVSPMAAKAVSAFKIRPVNLGCAPPARTETDGSRAAAPDQEARSRGSFDTSPIDMTQFTIVSARSFVEIQQRIKDNTEIIRKVAKERETLMVLIQDKTRENAMLSSLMIDLSDKQTLKSEELARKYASMTKELEKAINMKREMVRMHARIMGEDNLDCDVPTNQRAKTAAPRRDAESCPEGTLPLSEAAARLISNVFNEHVDCATSIQLTAPSNTAPTPFGEAMSGSADMAEVVEEASTVIVAPEPLGEAVSVSADVAGVGEAVAGSSDATEVGEAVAVSNASLLHLLSPFLSLLAEVGEAVAGR